MQCDEIIEMAVINHLNTNMLRSFQARMKTKHFDTKN